MKKTFTCYAIVMATMIFLWSCSSESEDVDCNSSNLSINVTNTINPGCSMSDGSITVSGSGGTGSYTFSIDNQNFVNQSTFSNLAAGTYTISVRDNNQCITSVEAVLNNESSVTITPSITDAGCETSNGRIVIAANGGTDPYMFRLNDNPFQSTSEFSGLPAGTYTVVVRDNNGCETSENVNIHSGLSLAGDVKPIIESKCAISGCHVGGGLPDFRNSSTIVANSGKIKTNTQSKIMPPAGATQLTDEEIRKIACWVDDGALNN